MEKEWREKTTDLTVERMLRLFQRNESLDFSLNVPQHHHSTSYHHNNYAMADQVSESFTLISISTRCVWLRCILNAAFVDERQTKRSRTGFLPCKKRKDERSRREQRSAMRGCFFGALLAAKAVGINRGRKLECIWPSASAGRAGVEETRWGVETRGSSGERAKCRV